MQTAGSVIEKLQRRRAARPEDFLGGARRMMAAGRGWIAAAWTAARGELARRKADRCAAAERRPSPAKAAPEGRRSGRRPSRETSETLIGASALVAMTVAGVLLYDQFPGREMAGVRPPRDAAVRNEAPRFPAAGLDEPAARSTLGYSVAPAPAAEGARIEAAFETPAVELPPRPKTGVMWSKAPPRAEALLRLSGLPDAACIVVAGDEDRGDDAAAVFLEAGQQAVAVLDVGAYRLRWACGVGEWLGPEGLFGPLTVIEEERATFEVTLDERGGFHGRTASLIDLRRRARSRGQLASERG